jgi:hypothetical protein
MCICTNKLVELQVPTVEPSTVGGDLASISLGLLEQQKTLCELFSIDEKHRLTPGLHQTAWYFLRGDPLGISASISCLAEKVQALSLVVPRAWFNEHFPAVPEPPKEFVFSDELPTCLFCVEPVHAGVRPCYNAECGLCRDSYCAAQYCHYECLRKNVWASQYDSENLRVYEYDRPSLCPLCKKESVLCILNLDVTCFLPQKLADAAGTATAPDASGRQIKIVGKRSDRAAAQIPAKRQRIDPAENREVPLKL